MINAPARYIPPTVGQIEIVIETGFATTDDGLTPSIDGGGIEGWIDGIW